MAGKESLEGGRRIHLTLASVIRPGEQGIASEWVESIDQG